MKKVEYKEVDLSHTVKPFVTDETTFVFTESEGYSLELLEKCKAEDKILVIYVPVSKRDEFEKIFFTCSNGNPEPILFFFDTKDEGFDEFKIRFQNEMVNYKPWYPHAGFNRGKINVEFTEGK